MSKYIKNEFENIVYDIREDKNYAKLKNDIHHGTSKYAHCNRVAYMAYRICKYFNLDYVNVARAGMLHDFFFGQRTDSEANSYTNHPVTSINNAKKFFEVNIKEEEMMRTHMYPHVFIKSLIPFKKNKRNIIEGMPKSKEAWILCLSDILVSFEEFGVYKVSFSLSILVLFLFNMLTINR